VGLVQILALLAIAHGGLLPGEVPGQPAGPGTALGPDPDDPLLRDVDGRRQRPPGGQGGTSSSPGWSTAIVVLRFGLLWLGYWTDAPFLAVVVGQLAIQIGLSLGPRRSG